MTEFAESRGHVGTNDGAARRARRHAAERRFRLYGILAIVVAVSFLVLLLGSIAVQGYTAFTATQIRLDVTFEPEVIDPEGTGDPELWAGADYGALIRHSLGARFPEVREPEEVRALMALISSGARFDLRDMVLDDPGLIGTTRSVWLPAAADIDMLVKGITPRDVPEDARRVKDNQIAWLDALVAEGAVKRALHLRFFTAGDSRTPERAGIWGAIVGSFYTMMVTLALAFPIGVLTAVYLEEFAPKNRWTDLVEININNLAAVPSIVFGLLGLAVFLNVYHLPRSAPVVGGMTLALMTLPTIIIATRSALAAVPPSLREAAPAIGASPLQVVMHHTLPAAMPGVMTGTIIGMARALGETAPLLMIGMVAFIADIPGGPSDPATVLPVQVFLWAGSSERAFAEKTAAATLVLLVFLIAMNGLAVYLRKKFEKRW